jgi:hypothetical protein
MGSMDKDGEQQFGPRINFEKHLILHMECNIVLIWQYRAKLSLFGEAAVVVFIWRDNINCPYLVKATLVVLIWR